MRQPHRDVLPEVYVSPWGIGGMVLIPWEGNRIPAPRGLGFYELFLLHERFFQQCR